MATGWAELWRRIRRLAEEGQQDHDDIWSRFKQVAERSERADILGHVVRTGEMVPGRQRYKLAVAVTRLLAPVEWPPEWKAPRVKLVSALDALVDETDPEAQPSLFSPHGPDGDDESLQVAHLFFVSSRDLLRRPCRRDELPTVAQLCNAGVALCLRQLRRASSRFKTGGKDAKQQTHAEFKESIGRFQLAFMDYMEAASELNDAAGAVLFEGLHASMEQEN